MVFCGRPSKGCAQCRSRKIRCDQAQPGCSNCVRGKLACSGYRDELSLLFRDESQKVIEKASGEVSGRPTKKQKRPNSAIKRNDRHDLQLTRKESDRAPFQLPRLSPSYQPTRDEAISWFLQHNGWSGALFMIDFDPSLLARTNVSLSERARFASLASVGMAMLSRARQSSELKENAEEEYGQALVHLTRAVSNEKDSRANATLAAVLLLAIFEVITSRTLASIEKWTSHIYGASALLDLRGQEELQSAEGRGLFIQLRFQVIMSCLQRGLRVPISLLECNKISMYLRPTEAYCDRIIQIAGHLANLRADINNGRLTDIDTILSVAHGVETDLIEWAAGVPPGLQYSTAKCSESGRGVEISGGNIPPYDQQYHLYHGLWIGHTWNQYRCSRIIICEIILACLRRRSLDSPGDFFSEEVQTRWSQLRHTSRDLAQDICASVPYHFGAKDRGDDGHRVPATQTYIGGMLLLWPLVLAGATENKGHRMRKWAAECLRAIGYGMGIDQAFAILEILETEAGIFEDLDETERGMGFEQTAHGRNNVFVVGAWISMLKRNL